MVKYTQQQENFDYFIVTQRFISINLWYPKIYLNVPCFFIDQALKGILICKTKCKICWEKNSKTNCEIGRAHV